MLCRAAGIWVSGMCVTAAGCTRDALSRRQRGWAGRAQRLGQDGLVQGRGGQQPCHYAGLQTSNAILGTSLSLAGTPAWAGIYGCGNQPSARLRFSITLRGCGDAQGRAGCPCFGLQPPKTEPWPWLPYKQSPRCPLRLCGCHHRLLLPLPGQQSHCSLQGQNPTAWTWRSPTPTAAPALGATDQGHPHGHPHPDTEQGHPRCRSPPSSAAPACILLIPRVSRHWREGGISPP